MAHNRQRAVKLPNNANLAVTLNEYQSLGYIVHQMINLAPVTNEILIIYYDPALEPEPEPVPNP